MKHLLEALNGRLPIHSSDSDLKQLLNDVRESKDSKSSENFYETLEKVLGELRSTDHAIAFLKPVRRSEAPDYDKYIKHPMDLSTMLKKVKGHVYKNKKDFTDDLNLIWENCLIYNSDPHHPLRRSVAFMRKKADHIMERITDKNERPQQLNIRLKPPALHYPKSRTIESSDEESSMGTPGRHHNHMVNGKLGGHNANGSTSTSGAINGIAMKNGITLHARTNGVASSAGTPSHDDTQQSILGKRRQGREDVPFGDRRAIVRTPQSMATFRDLDNDLQRYLDSEGAGPSRLPFSTAHSRHEVGERVCKKLKAVVGNSDADPSFNLFGYDVNRQDASSSNMDKRSQRDSTATKDDEKVFGAWWQVMADDNMRAAGLPPLSQDGQHPPASQPSASSRSRIKPRKKRPPKKSSSSSSKPNGLESLMVKNVNTLRTMRKVHTQLSAIQAGAEPRALSPPPHPPPLDGEPRGLFKKPDRKHPPIPLDGGERTAKTLLTKKTSMVLEHAGFEATSKAALEVLSEVTADFMMNLGRTIRFYCDKYSHTMTSEEIILHTLFENGVIEIQELERYIKDDIERYGTRITELERKLTSVYREQVESIPIEDDMLFDPEGDALVVGNFTEELGEDFFGFRALGLDKEFGMSSLSIPSRLFHGRNKAANASDADGAASKEPPPPYPPPQAFIPLKLANLESQPGLLQPFYRDRFEKLPAPAAAPSAGFPMAPLNPLYPPSLHPTYPLTPNNTPVVYGSVPPTAAPTSALSNANLTLPDDPPNPLKIKMGPLGQIALPTASSAKPKPAKPPGPGKGNGKKAKALALAAAAAAASGGDNSGDGASGGGGDGGGGRGTSAGDGQSAQGGGKGTTARTTANGGAATTSNTSVAVTGGGVNATSNTAGAASAVTTTKKKSTKASKKKSASVAPGANGTGTPQLGTIVMASA